MTSDDVICLHRQVDRQEAIVKDTCTQEKSSLSSAGMHGCFRQEVTSESEGETQLAAPHQYLQEHPRLYIINAVYLCTLQAILFVCVWQGYYFYQKSLEILRINLPLSRKVHVGKALQSHSGKSCRAAVLRNSERPLVLRIIIRWHLSWNRFH